MEDGSVAEHGERDCLAADSTSRYARLLRVADGDSPLDEILR